MRHILHIPHSIMTSSQAFHNDGRTFIAAADLDELVERGQGSIRQVIEEVVSDIPFRRVIR